MLKNVKNMLLALTLMIAMPVYSMNNAQAEPLPNSSKKSSEAKNVSTPGIIALALSPFFVFLCIQESIKIESSKYAIENSNIFSNSRDNGNLQRLGAENNELTFKHVESLKFWLPYHKACFLTSCIIVAYGSYSGYHYLSDKIKERKEKAQADLKNGAK